MEKAGKSIGLNVEKVGKFWIVELFFIGHESIWLARDKNQGKALDKAHNKIDQLRLKLIKKEKGE